MLAPSRERTFSESSTSPQLLPLPTVSTRNVGERNILIFDLGGGTLDVSLLVFSKSKPPLVIPILVEKISIIVSSTTSSRNSSKRFEFSDPLYSTAPNTTIAHDDRGARQIGPKCLVCFLVITVLLLLNNNLGLNYQNTTRTTKGHHRHNGHNGQGKGGKGLRPDMSRAPGYVFCSYFFSTNFLFTFKTTTMTTNGQATTSTHRNGGNSSSNSNNGSSRGSRHVCVSSPR